MECPISDTYATAYVCGETYHDIAVAIQLNSCCLCKVVMQQAVLFTLC